MPSKSVAGALIVAVMALALDGSSIEAIANRVKEKNVAGLTGCSAIMSASLVRKAGAEAFLVFRLAGQ